MEDKHDSLILRKGENRSDAKGEYGLVVEVNADEGAVSNVEDEQNPEHAVEDEGPDYHYQDRPTGNPSMPENYDNIENTHSSGTVLIPREWQRVLLTPILPDNRFMVAGTLLVDGMKAVRLLKFTAFTWIGLIVMFYFVRFMGFEHDESYSVPDMILYDGHAILLDTMFFFAVGRLYQQRGIDHIAWISVAMLSGLFSSGETEFRFLQNSVTLYSMHCVWPWQLWFFALSIIALCTIVIVKHIKYLVEHQLLVVKIMEMTLCVLLFLVPPISSPYFHFHHWFAGWLVGMHCNLDTWWGRLTMAWCWGAYINGIAVYGRDPVLTCGYSLYLSYGDHCPYLQCYIDAMHHKNHSHYKPMEPQDWWNCTAEDYKP